MLIAPRIEALGIEVTMPFQLDKFRSFYEEEEEFAEDLTHTAEEGDYDIKLAELGHVVHYRKLQNREIKVLGHYQLSCFFVKNNKACWEFTSLNNDVFKGSFRSLFLSANLSVKLILPLVILHNKGKLRTTFRFRTDPDCCVVTTPVFKRLFGEME